MNNNRQLLASAKQSIARFNAGGNRPANFALGTPNMGYGMQHNALGSQFGQPSMTYRANGGGQATTTAPLFAIQIVNNSLSAISNLNILGAFANVTSPTIGGSAGTWTNGNLVQGGVTISTLFNTLTYQQFLGSTQVQPYRVGAIYLQVISGTTALAGDLFTIDTRSQSGATQSLPLKPFIAPTQFQSNITMNYCSFSVDGFTSLTWSNFYAQTTLQVSFFPETTVNPSAALSGNGVVGNYGSAPVQ